MTEAELAAMGAQLRAAGLTPRALAAWAGTDRVSALPARLAEVGARPVTPASAALGAYVAGAVNAAGERPGYAVLPLGPSLLVCDHADAPASERRVAWPDDSSYHLALALPAGRRARWLDLGCGSGFAPLLRPDLAAAIDAVDLNPRAVAWTWLGARLSGIAHIAAWEADLAAAPGGPYELITCNAPIPGAPDVELWRRADPGLFGRLWTAALGRIAPAGWIVVHGALAELEAAPAIGTRVVVAYTPEDAPAAFGVLWWRPDAADRAVVRRRVLDVARPHVSAQDYLDAVT